MDFITYKQWEQLPDSAKLLFAEAEKNSLFLSRIWLEPLSKHSLEQDQSLLLACVIKDKAVLAILPMILCKQGSLSALSNRFTTLYSVLTRSRENQHSILDCLAKGLSKLPVRPIRFEPIDSKDELMNELKHALELYGLQHQSLLRFYNWTHAVNHQSFEEYFAERPSYLLNTIKRKQSKLTREHNYTIRLFKNSGIQQAVYDYQSVYQASWKTNEFFSDFTPALVHELAAKGYLRLGILYIEEQAIEAQIWFVLHGKANIYRLAYDENWKHFSPGSILTKFLMQHVIDTDKVTEIDFLTGNEKYKQDWMSVRKERIGMVFAKQQPSANFAKRLIYSLKIFYSSSNLTKWII